MPYEARPDIANRRAKAMNSQIFPNEVTEIVGDFGITPVPIYIYNVGPIEHKTANSPAILIRACPKDQDYILASTQSHPVQELVYDQNYNKKIEYVDGYRYVTRLLSPMNPGTDQNFTENAQDEIAVGGNLNDYGVFWSKNNPPTKEELDAMRARLERTLRKELSVIHNLEATEPDKALQRINRISHVAADYFGEQTSWHRTDYKKRDSFEEVPCVECGESIKRIAKKCRFCNVKYLINAGDQRLEGEKIDQEVEVKRVGKPSTKTIS